MTSTNFSSFTKGHDAIFLQFVPQDLNDEPAPGPRESTSTPARARPSKRAP